MSGAFEPVERLARESLRQLQLERLRSTFNYSDEELPSLDDVARLPFTVKSELREAYPFGLLRVPVSDLARVHASSGTRAKPTVVGYTRADLEAWTELMARCMTMAGVRPGMLVHNANTYGLFTGGHGFHQGAERIGAATGDSDVHRNPRRPSKAPPVGRTAMAEDGAVAAREQGAHEAPLLGDSLVAEQIHATEIAIEAARAEPVSDGSVSSAEVEQLLARNRTALSSGDFTRRHQAWSIERLTISSWIDHVGHGATLARETARFQTRA